ncbi:unnamed protein product [Boreogadus saida]
MCPATLRDEPLPHWAQGTPGLGSLVSALWDPPVTIAERPRGRGSAISCPGLLRSGVTHGTAGPWEREPGGAPTVRHSRPANEHTGGSCRAALTGRPLGADGSGGGKPVQQQTTVRDVDWDQAALGGPSPPP